MRDINKKMTTPNLAGPMERWRAPAARCLNRGVILSSRLRNTLFVLFLGGILAYGAGFAWYMLARFDLINLISNTHDDAFYYFQIARNLAEGKFSTFDGGITRTNGYHPIWLFLITPFYWVFDPERALFAIKAFEIILVAGGVALAAAAARLTHMPWYLMFAALPVLYHIPFMIAGMEAAAALFMLGLFILTACLFARSPARWKWPLAAVAFALPWVRLEYIAISLAATAALCLVEWSRQKRTPGASLGKRTRSVRSVKAVVPFLASGAGILVYFAYNRLVFGGIVPVSGATKAARSRFRWEQEGGYSLAQNFQDVLQISVFDHELLVALEICAYLLLVWWFTRRSRSREDWLPLAFLVGVFGLAVGHLAKFAQTVLTIHPSLGPWPWYFVPAYLLMTLIVPVRCYVAIYFIRRFIGPRSPWAANILSVGIVIAGAVFLFAKADFTEPFQRAEAISVSTRTDDKWIKAVSHNEWTEAVYGGTQLMNRVLPEDSVVGAWDAGVIGYFSRFPVVNLDGLVNSYDYFHARTPAGDGYAPLYREFGITHFAQPTHFEGSPLKILNRWELRLRPIGLPADENTVARTWEKIEPHFDHQSDGIGLIVDGRLALAFVRNCAPNELTVLSWVGLGEETVAKDWTQTGPCVAAFVLPHNARPPVSVETTDVPLGDYLARLLGDNQPAIRSDWEVYLVGNSLIYKKEQCTPEDVEPMFFLHLDPGDVNDLPSHRKQYGFDNLDFAFGNYRIPIKGEVCAAGRVLPDYGIAGIRTGQFTGEGEIWKGSFDLAEPADDGNAVP